MSRLPQTDQSLTRHLRQQKRAMVRAANGSPYNLSGTRVTAENEVTVDGSLIVDGDLGTTGTTTLGGNVAITGTLSLPAGIIDNEALANPISAAVDHADAIGFSITTGANVEKARCTIAVPTGFTKALVYASATMSVYNSTGALDDAFVGVNINGLTPAGYSGQASAPANAKAHVVDVSTAFLTGLSGTFYVAGLASSGTATWTSPTSTMNVDAMVLFLR